MLAPEWVCILCICIISKLAEGHDEYVKTRKKLCEITQKMPKSNGAYRNINTI